MSYSAINNEEEYEEVTHRIEQLKDAEPGTDEAKELKALIKLLIDYEKQQIQNHRKILSN